MTPLRLVAAALAAACFFLSGCGPRDGAYDNVHFHIRGLLVPPDIIAHNGRDGVYFTRGTGDAITLCCWTAQHAAPTVRKPHPASTMRITVYIPESDFFRDHEQVLTIRFAGYPATTRIHYRKADPGFKEHDVRLPRGLQNKIGTVRVLLDSALAYAPVPLGVPGHEIQYGVFLTSIYFE